MKLYGNALRAQSGYVRQSYAGIVRQRLLVIEQDIGQGLRHEAIRQRLLEEGHGASMGTFRKTLSRARIWWRRQLLQAGYAIDTESTSQAKASASEQPTPIHSSPRVVERTQPAGSETHTSTNVPHPNKETQRSPALDLDRFFQPKSVFSKTK